MQVQRLLRLQDTDTGLKVHIRWRGLPASENTTKPIQQVYKNVPSLLIKLIDRKATPKDLQTKARRVLDLLDEGL